MALLTRHGQAVDLPRLRDRHPDLYTQIDPGIRSTDWNVNIKAVGRGKRALRYLAAYVNKSAFSEQRLARYDLIFHHLYQVLISRFRINKIDDKNGIN